MPFSLSDNDKKRLLFFFFFHSFFALIKHNNTHIHTINLYSGISESNPLDIQFILLALHRLRYFALSAVFFMIMYYDFLRRVHVLFVSQNITSIAVDFYFWLSHFSFPFFGSGFNFVLSNWYSIRWERKKKTRKCRRKHKK